MITAGTKSRLAHTDAFRPTFEAQEAGSVVKRTSHKDAGCAVARPLDAIGDSWSLLIVRDVFDGLHRFGEFQKNLGLAKNILSARLRNLVDHGILESVPASDGSPYQEYVLTEKGRGLFPLLVAIRQWGEDFFFEDDQAAVQLVDRKRGLPVRKLELRAQDGRVLNPEDTVVTAMSARTGEKTPVRLRVRTGKG
jgi:DNA-binding HxlR family transcriptional regulator